LRFHVVDLPSAAPERKVHRVPTPLLGGVAIFLGFFLVLLVSMIQHKGVLGPNILPKYVWGMFVASTVLMIGGWLDDRRHLKPQHQIIFPVLATLTVIVSGIGIPVVTNPFGGAVHLNQVNIEVFRWHGIAYHWTLWADLLTFVWLMGMMYTTKFLDGLDGLVSGITAIGSITVFVLSVRPPVLQFDTANLAIILAGACIGFLIWNWHPAKIFLGEGGSLFTGFLLGTLAIIAGSKIATALLILGIPMLDVVWVIIRRSFFERRSPFTTADRKHLHFRLLDVGFSHHGAVLFLYALTAAFGVTTIVFHGIQKVAALGVLGLVMLLLGIFLVFKTRRKKALASYRPEH
jgi:UDP-GlcNAc:undecaprenyl-phosphate GlcNAc-1-phosphate transferase